VGIDKASTRRIVAMGVCIVIRICGWVVCRGYPGLLSAFLAMLNETARDLVLGRGSRWCVFEMRMGDNRRSRHSTSEAYINSMDLASIKARAEEMYTSNYLFVITELIPPAHVPVAPPFRIAHPSPTQLNLVPHSPCSISPPLCLSLSLPSIPSSSLPHSSSTRAELLLHLTCLV
jgi:hypothetical protein